jgi:hypothetical protein
MALAEMFDGKAEAVVRRDDGPRHVVVIVSSMWRQIWGRASQICVEESLCLMIPLFLS